LGDRVEKLLIAKWLSYEPTPPCLEHLKNTAILNEARVNQDCLIWIKCSNAPKSFAAVYSRHHHIDHNQIDSLGFRLLPGFT